jgi:hypothetical protein
VEEKPSQEQTPEETRRSGTRPSGETRSADRAEAEVRAGADRPPTQDEVAVAEEEPPVDDDQRAHAEEMLDLGANQKGEGRIP